MWGALSIIILIIFLVRRCTNRRGYDRLNDNDSEIPLSQITVTPITPPLSLNLTPSRQQRPRTPSPPPSKPDVQSDDSPIVS